MTKSANVPSNRIPELDLLRFIAASSVVMYHFTYRPALHGVVDEHAFGLVQSASKFGYLGVNLFFMISGFVILWSSQGRNAVEFAISRFSRLYPSFWVCVLLTTLVLNATGVADPIAMKRLGVNLTMVAGLLGVDYVDGVYWTLLVELKFYAIVFFILLFGLFRYVETLIALWLAASVVSAVGIGPHAIASLTMYPLGAYFISGCVLFLIRTRGLTPLRGLALTTSCALAVQEVLGAQSGFMHDLSSSTAAVVVTAVIVFHIVFTVIAVKPGILGNARWPYALGVLTYPLYLLHNRIGRTVRALVESSISEWLTLLVMLVVVYALAWLVALVVERRVCGALNKALLRVATRVGLVRPKETQPA